MAFPRPDTRCEASAADRAAARPERNAIPGLRAADAYAPADKWHGWILAATGHGEEWARVFHGSGDRGPDSLTVLRSGEITAFDRVELLEPTGRRWRARPRP